MVKVARAAMSNGLNVMVIKEMAGPNGVVTMEKITKMEVDCGICHF